MRSCLMNWKREVQYSMSKENAKLFIQKVDKNPELCALVNADGADFVSIARDAGFELTQEELDEAIQEIRKERKNAVIESLSPEDLDKVADGSDCPRNSFVFMKMLQMVTR